MIRTCAMAAAIPALVLAGALRRLRLPAGLAAALLGAASLLAGFLVARGAS